MLGVGFEELPVDVQPLKNFCTNTRSSAGVVGVRLDYTLFGKAYGRRGKDRENLGVSGKDHRLGAGVAGERLDYTLFGKD